MNGKCNSKTNTIRAFFPKIRTLFLIFKKGQGRPPTFPLSCAPEYLDVNWKMYNPGTVLIHTGISDVLNDKSPSNTENVLSNIKYMFKKCLKFGMKNIFISGLVYTTRISLKVFKKTNEKLSIMCSSYGLIHTDNRNSRGLHLCRDTLPLLQLDKKVFSNLFSSIDSFVDEHELHNLVEEITCFKSVYNPTLRENCPNTELFLVGIFLYSIRIQKIRTRNNSVFGHFSCSVMV